MAKDIDQTGFQLDPKELSKNLPWAIRGQAEGFFKSLNSFDGLNRNGKSDIAEIGGLIMHSIPVLSMINQAIDFELVAAHIADMPGVKDKALLKSALLELGRLAEKADDLVPKEPSK